MYIYKRAITNYMYIFTALILFILTNTAMQQKKINLMNLNQVSEGGCEAAERVNVLKLSRYEILYGIIKKPKKPLFMDK